MKTLIKNGNIVVKDQILKADLLIENDKIIEISKNIKCDYDKLIDAGVISGTKLNPTRPW
jgi:dihydroorotase-like cyclic amidohydrolase